MGVIFFGWWRGGGGGGGHVLDPFGSLGNSGMLGIYKDLNTVDG